MQGKEDHDHVLWKEERSVVAYFRLPTMKSNDGPWRDFDAIIQDLPCPKIDAKPSKTKLEAESN